MRTSTQISLVAMAIVAIMNQPGSAEPQVVSQTTTTRLLGGGPGFGVGGFAGVGGGFGVGGFGGGFRPGFGGVGPGFGGVGGFGGGFRPGFGGFRPGFGGPFRPGFGGIGPGFGGVGPGFGGFRPGFGINPFGPPRPVIRPVFSPVAGVVPAVVGFRGRSGDSDDGGSPSTGCRHWCTNPTTGQAFCCRTAHEPHAPVGTKPGQCPPLRPSCPTGGGFGGPSSCSSDGGCAGVDKCCFDTCLETNVCKPPEGFGR